MGLLLYIHGLYETTSEDAPDKKASTGPAIVMDVSPTRIGERHLAQALEHRQIKGGLDTLRLYGYILPLFTALGLALVSEKC